MIGYVPFFFMAIGLLMYGYGTEKLAEVGRMLFFAGALAFALAFGISSFKLPAR